MNNPKHFFLTGAFLVIAVTGSAGAMAAPALVKEKQCDTCHRFASGPAEKEQYGPDLFSPATSSRRNGWRIFYNIPRRSGWQGIRGIRAF